MSDEEALERRLLPKKARGTAEEFWTLVTRRRALADAEAAGSDREKQHVALAALFAGRGFGAGERDPGRLTEYLALFRRAQSRQCFPSDLASVQSRITRELRTIAGTSEPNVTTKKAKVVSTEVALFLASDETKFDALSNDHARWADDAGMNGVVSAGEGLFVHTGADGPMRLEVRVLDRDELGPTTRELAGLSAQTDPVFLALPSGVLRFGQPCATKAEALTVDVEPGVYRAALFSLAHGEKVLLVLARVDRDVAANELPTTMARYGQSTPGILVF